ncbi:hypothetical protein [Pseudoramibacter sp.]|nr:hypothetical protein [Pseudoramibacter sp.]MCH4071695.1 hypothetical protein [Pseudoramibacter sp.]
MAERLPVPSRCGSLRSWQSEALRAAREAVTLKMKRAVLRPMRVVPR